MPDANTHPQNPQYLVAGDQSAARDLQRVLSLHLPSFYRCALRVLGNRDDAEDAVQEALLAAHKHLHQFRGRPVITSDCHLTVSTLLTQAPPIFRTRSLYFIDTRHHGRELADSQFGICVALPVRRRGASVETLIHRSQCRTRCGDSPFLSGVGPDQPRGASDSNHHGHRH